MKQTMDEKMEELNWAAVSCGFDSAQEQAEYLVAEQYPATQDVEGAARRLVAAALKNSNSIGRTAAIGGF